MTSAQLVCVKHNNEKNIRTENRRSVDLTLDSKSQKGEDNS